MAELAAGDGTVMKAEAIADRQVISLKYLLDILGDLKRASLVRSKRGPDGGFVLARAAHDISLADIFRAVDGPLADVHDTALSGLEYPPPAQSLVAVWMAVRGSLRSVLETVSIADLVSGRLPPPVMALADDYRQTTHDRYGI